MNKKYFIKYGNLPEVEVSKEKFMDIERSCEFYPKTWGETATGGFSFSKQGVDIKGKIKRYTKD